MTLTEFSSILSEVGEDQALVEFCRKYVIHGTPYVFQNRAAEFYEFRKRIATKFGIPYYEVRIMGSAKLGFSFHKRKEFDYDSDIDVAIVSSILYDEIMQNISSYQMSLRRGRHTVSERELRMYHEFLEYVAIGWLRPDKLPVSFQIKAIKDDWFSFFRELSYGNSEVGNYKVTAGVFRNYKALELYTCDGLDQVQKSMRLGAN